jgi:hypothetical protein
MASPRRAGGYIDRELLEQAILQNALMSALMLQVSEERLPANVLPQLLRCATLLAEQGRALRQMQTIRRENGNA